MGSHATVRTDHVRKTGLAYEPFWIRWVIQGSRIRSTASRRTKRKIRHSPYQNGPIFLTRSETDESVTGNEHQRRDRTRDRMLPAKRFQPERTYTNRFIMTNEGQSCWPARDPLIAFASLRRGELELELTWPAEVAKVSDRDNQVIKRLQTLSVAWSHSRRLVAVSPVLKWLPPLRYGWKLMNGTSDH